MRQNSRYPPPKRLLSPDEIDAAVAYVAEAARSAGAWFALIGGVAMHAYGSPRLTGDVDIALERGIDVAALEPIGVLSFGGYKARTPSGVDIDVVLRDDDYAVLYERVIETAEDIDGVPVARAEYLVAMKMAANRPKDWADIEYLVTTDAFDVASARTVIREHLGPFAVDEFDAFVRAARWRHEREHE